MAVWGLVQLNLVPHPSNTPADPPFKVWATVDHAGAFGAMATTNIWFAIGAPIDRFVLPGGQGGERRDGLWEATCFEAFLRQTNETSYREWNFAPSGDWAAYDFAAYRDGVKEPDVDHPPYIRVEDNLTWWTLGATIAVASARDWDLGLSAVLEERDGTKSYWALAHTNSERPDFHLPDCFVAKLA
jgi:hypothetical protein